VLGTRQTYGVAVGELEVVDKVSGEPRGGGRDENSCELCWLTAGRGSSKYELRSGPNYNLLAGCHSHSPN